MNYLTIPLLLLLSLTTLVRSQAASPNQINSLLSDHQARLEARSVSELKFQNTTASGPEAPIRQLFAAMNLGDTTGLAAIFHPEAQLSTVLQKEGKVSTHVTEIIGFILQIAKTKPGILLEEIHHLEVRQDGDLATVWTPYTFVYEGKISHCGTNAFQLTRTGKEGSWQIFRIIDTRYKEGCTRKTTTTATEKINHLADAWHLAATNADGKAYFDLMDENSIFIGTDATEHWDKAEFKAFALPYFDKGKAWDFKKIERHIFVDENENIAYWDELLDTWMGPCRGTGIAQRQADGSYLIKHYTLSVTIDNDKIQDFIKIVEGSKE